MDDFALGYIECMLWSEGDQTNDQGGNPLDETYDIEDFSPEALKQIVNDCSKFQKESGSLLTDLDAGQAGHDFWLTRNGHGAGFWDGDYEKAIGETLTKISKQFGSINIYVGIDDKLHLG